MIYKYRTLSSEIDDFVLDVELDASSNLRDLHTIISRQVGFNECELYSFFVSDVEWEKFQEYTLIDMKVEDGDLEFQTCEDCGLPIPMRKAVLSDISPKLFDRLVYVFDPIHERELYVELIGIADAADGVAYPHIADHKGSTITQYLAVE